MADGGAWGIGSENRHCVASRRANASYRLLTGYGEDGAEIHDTGRATVNMTVPTRYLHGHTGVIQRTDFDGAVELLLQVLTRLDTKTVTQLSSFAP